MAKKSSKNADKNSNGTGAEGHKADKEVLLDVRDLRISFNTDGGTVRAVRGLTFQLRRGETLGIVGESGSGKSVSQLGILGLLPVPPAQIESGTARYRDLDLLKLNNKEMRQVRGGKIAMIFQDPMTSLNPFMRVGKQLEEVLEVHTDDGRAKRKERALKMMRLVGLPAPEQRYSSYPHEMSGGMRQRIMIAMALMCDPELLIADEPTTALDVTIQAQILELLNWLNDELGTAVVLITHDLGVVAGMADRVLVMYAGQVMEEGPVEALFAKPCHPYTRGLLGSIPRLDGDGGRLTPIAGQPPDPTNMPKGCPFAPRCDHAIETCRTQELTSWSPQEGHRVHCSRPELFQSKTEEVAE